MFMNTTQTTTLVHHRRFNGVVVRAKAAKTIAVRVETKAMHPKYRKQYTQSRTYLVHDEHSVAKVGDAVLFEECRPLSKLKRWRLLSLVTSA